MLNLAPGALHALGDLLDAVDETPLHRLGEVDPTDQPGQRDLGPQQIAVVASIARLLALGDRPDPFLAAHHVLTGLPERLGLRQQRPGTAVDPLFGYLVVVEVHQLPDRAVTAS